MAAIEPAEISVNLTITLDTVIGSHYRQGYIMNRHGEPEETSSETPYTFQDAIIDRTAGLLMSKILTDTTHYQSMRSLVGRRLDEGLAERIKPMIDEALAKPIVKTNPYGEAKGETTMTELVIDEVRRLLNHGRGTYEKSMLDKALQGVTERALAKELADEIDQAKSSVREAVRKVTANALTAAIAKEIGA